jgi:tetratricopeptide (TPR) repeat protein
MHWLLIESILKGLFLGLCALFLSQAPVWAETGRLAACVGIALAIAMAIGAAQQFGQGHRAKGRWPAFLLLLVLENPLAAYAGVLLGMAAGVAWIGMNEWRGRSLPILAAAVALGVVIWLLRSIRHPWLRFALSVLPACALVAAGMYWLSQNPAIGRDPERRALLAVQLLLAIPLFYLLTFAGRAEESEVDIGLVCAALGLALWLLVRENPETQWLILLLPLGLYYFYTTTLLPKLRIYKHAVRGISFARAGRFRPALQSYRRALQLDPQNRLARDRLWSLHRAMDVQEVARDRETLALVDFELCMERASSLLLAASPGPEKLAEAEHLLDLVVSQRPELNAAVAYWRAVARTHGGQYDQAAALLEELLDPSRYSADDASRTGILFRAWQLALLLHPELNRRVGSKQLGLPGRRIEAIAAVERRLAVTVDDAEAWDVKRVVYSTLTEADYTNAAGDSGVLRDFDHEYARQLGLALVVDPARWERGAECLRIAARGLTSMGPTIFHQLAQAYERAGNHEEAIHSYELGKQSGLKAGIKNLGDAERQTFFAVVKQLAEEARAKGDIDRAIENYRLLTESERSGVETIRALAALYEQKGNVIAALHATEQGLVYNARDRDLLERKDRYYYSLMPEDARANLETIQPFFDLAYCVNKARSLVDIKNADLDVIDWAEHLARLALVVKPESLAAKIVLARTLRRRGEIAQAQTLLEEIYQAKPENEADENAWYLACRLLGEMYLYELGKPDLALTCLASYRKSAKSGADTLFKMGQAYEQLGDRARARKCYESVQAYEGHPLVPDAREALYRLQSQ